MSAPFITVPKMTLEEVIAVMERAEAAGKMTVRLHTGDPCIYGAIREQMDILDEKGIAYDYCPGVSAFCGAASALNLEYTLPDISQSVIITRMEGRTPVPSKRKHSVFCGTSGNNGCIFKHRYAGRTEQKTDRGRIQAKTHRQRSFTRQPGRMRKKFVCTVGTLGTNCSRK